MLSGPALGSPGNYCDHDDDDNKDDDADDDDNDDVGDHVFLIDSPPS